MDWAASKDLRQRVVDAYLRGNATYDEIAERFGVGRASVSRWLRRARETGDVAPKRRGGGRPGKVDASGLRLLRDLVEDRPDATLAELRDAFARKTGISIAVCIVHRKLKRMGITRKKRASTPRSAIPTE